uniref:Glutaredoxin n=1 Tax=Sebdenia flabellata TaxID=42024 RepID=A0A1C9C9Y7_9FLOR|nr:hypothetical protein Sebd_098 [Sebdenia flabellata]AOM65185.1 hypothetical protein Sebd_098 [Sebdenia flabellata]
MNNKKGTEIKIKNLIKKHKILVFMKGEKTKPACSFSSKVIEILNNFSIDYHTINVLKDNNIKEQIKKYSKWPTIPQIYIDQEFIGGADIIVNLYKTSKLEEILEKTLNS